MMLLSSRTGIRAKVIMLAVLAAGGAIAMVTAATIWRETEQALEIPDQQLSIQAQVIAHNAAAPLLFDDRAAAEHLLSSLHAIPSITAAAVFDRHGRIFGTYGDVATLRHGGGQMRNGDVEANGHRHAYRPVTHDGDDLGHVQIVYDLSSTYAEIRGDSAVTLAIGVMGVLTAMVLALRLQRLVTRPILDLHRTVGAVADSGDYSIRARKQSDDELGALTDGFNAMLSQIEIRDHALAEARDHLEQQVADRTDKLQAATEQAVGTAEELRYSEAIIRATLEATADGILVVGTHGDLLQLNQRFITMWGITDDLIGHNHDDLLISHVLQQLIDPDTFLSRVESLTDSAETHTDLLELRNGQCYESFTAPLTRDGALAGRVWCFRDITERRAAESERERLNRQLIDSSRKVGMAEVAASVLHNVGNVLNSVNVSAGLLHERVRKSRMSSLVKTAALLQENQGRLAQFITEDERGKQLPDYLNKLAAHLSGEQTSLTNEVESLLQSVEHIKEVVNTQQSYARAGGLTESVGMRQLIGDAVRMNCAALDRHGVRLVEDYQDTPQINVDKHKLLQILVDLISNAKYALSDCPQPDRTLTLRLSATDDPPRYIVIEVIDNGKGIAGDHLTRIFSYGFTTRVSGHGFGLHSAALAAKELGGSLSAHSDGPGKGAVFTLRLPIDTHRATDDAAASDQTEHVTTHEDTH